MAQIKVATYQELQTIASAHPPTTNQSLIGFVNWAKNNPAKRFNKNQSSYSLKHSCENIAELLGPGEYCSNEDLIVALVQAGIPAINCRSDGNLGGNYYFQIKELNDHDLQRIADSIDGGSRWTLKHEKEERRDLRNRRNQYREWLREHFARNGISDYIKYTYYYGGRSSAFSCQSGFDIVRVLPVEHHSIAEKVAIKCEQIYREIDRDWEHNQWIAAWSPQDGLRQVAGVWHQHHGRTTTFFIGDELIVTLVGGKKSNWYRERFDTQAVFIQGKNRNLIDDYEKWLTVFFLKTTR